MLSNNIGNHRKCFIEKGVRKNFAKFTGKHLRQSLFFNKVAEPSVFSEFLKNTSRWLFLCKSLNLIFFQIINWKVSSFLVLRTSTSVVFIEDFQNLQVLHWWIACYKIKGVFTWRKNIPAKWESRLNEIWPYKKILLKNQNLNQKRLSKNKLSHLTGIPLS